MVTFALRIEDTHVQLNVDMKAVFWAFFPHLLGELKQKLEVSIEISYLWSFERSLDWTAMVNFTR